jgi:hypothetical protein
MTKSNKADYYSSTSIKKDLLERSRARAEYKNKQVYKVIGKSAKVLKKTLVPVVIKSSGSGYTTCCGKAGCAFCGEIPIKSYASIPYVGFWNEKPKSYFVKIKELSNWEGVWAVSELQAEKRIARSKKAVHKNQIKINK